MTDNGNGFSRWLARASEVLEVAGKVTLAPFLLLLFVLFAAVYFGYIVSPYSGVPGAIRAHDERMAALGTDRARVDTEFLSALREMRSDMTRNSIVYRLRICSEIRDLPLQRRCLES